MIKQNYKHEHMFRICFVWVYIIKGFCPLLSLQASAGFVSARFRTLVGDILTLPEVVLYNGKQNGLFRVLLSCNFLRQCAVLSLYISERLEMTDQRFKQARQRSKNVVWRQVYFVVQILGATLLQLHIRISNPCEVETLLSVF